MFVLNMEKIAFRTLGSHSNLLELEEIMLPDDAQSLVNDLFVHN